MLTVTAVRHAFPEREGFFIDRRSGHTDYTLLHFHNAVVMRLGEQTVTTLPHAVILYRPGTPQYFRSTGSLIHDWIHFSGETEELTDAAGFCPDTVCYPACPELITRLTAEIETEHLGGWANGERLAGLKLEELLLRIGRLLSEPQPGSVDREIAERFRYLRGEMFSRLDERWTVERMADEVHLSQSRFHALYRSIYGISPTEDLIRARMDRAKNRLVFGEQTVAQIAEELAYQNTTHFIRQFRERVGMTPVQYRHSRSADR